MTIKTVLIISRFYFNDCIDHIYFDADSLVFNKKATYQSLFYWVSLSQQTLPCLENSKHKSHHLLTFITIGLIGKWSCKLKEDSYHMHEWELHTQRSQNTRPWPGHLDIPALQRSRRMLSIAWHLMAAAASLKMLSLQLQLRSLLSQLQPRSPKKLAQMHYLYCYRYHHPYNPLY